MENKKITIEFGGLSTLLLVAFIVLKLCHVIEWSWAWVLAPLWIPFLFVLLVIVVVFIVTVVGLIIDKSIKKNS